MAREGHTLIGKRRSPEQITDRGEFFATAMSPIERTPEYVRLIFFSNRQTLSIALTPAAFRLLTGLVALGDDRILN